MEPNTEPPAEVLLEKIHPGGDMILLVGHAGTKRRLLVSSTILLGASKYFGNLLGPNWAEGQTEGSTEHPKEIQLPDDDARAMSDMCNLIHGKEVDGLLKDVALERIVALAFLIDFYDCSEALRTQSEKILDAHCWKDIPVDFEVHGQLLLASYLLRCCWEFKHLSSMLVCKTNQEYDDIWDRKWADSLPTEWTSKLRLWIREIRALRTGAQIEVIHGLTELCSNPSVYFNQPIEKHTGRLRRLFQIESWTPNIFPGGDWAITKAIGIIDKICVRFCCTCGDVCLSGRDQLFVDRMAFEDLVCHLKELGEGLCLECILEGQVNPTVEDCLDHAVRWRFQSTH